MTGYRQPLNGVPYVFNVGRLPSINLWDNIIIIKYFSPDIDSKICLGRLTVCLRPILKSLLLIVRLFKVNNVYRWIQIKKIV